MHDENAFGLLVSYYDVENDEYALEREDFVARFTEFKNLMLDCVESFPLGESLRAVDLGHAVYVEMADGDQEEDPIVWLKMVRARLTGRELRSVGVLSYGSRWLDDDDELPEAIDMNKAEWVSVSRPSEPLRRALYAETASRQDEDDAPDGWGPGLYVDTEAVEALGRALKNAPTPLAVAGATFFRVAR
ncbi:MAG: hypothetical protein KC776_04145 [Myxococcales bacterium]|nr:hypothetical protein [Myxococcales bacterium]MCB9580021.1 hypothetical protein [Polyangiaceae bacterium]